MLFLALNYAQNCKENRGLFSSFFVIVSFSLSLLPLQFAQAGYTKRRKTANR
jgi:hypothetical protein